MSSAKTHVGDILQGTKTGRLFVCTFSGKKDIVVRGFDKRKKKYRKENFKGFKNLSSAVRCGLLGAVRG